jgi:transcriptional regulator with XRE-family HTH domain
MSLGTNIKKIRESKGLEIEEVVKKLNIFITQYVNIEKNIIKPNSILLNKIANVLGVSERYIKDYNEEKEKEELLLKQRVDLKNLNITSKELDTNLRRRSADFAKKPILITSKELEELGKDINLVGENENYIQNIEEEIDPLEGLIFDEGKTFSPFLLNWIEPYIISGFRKTLFYTEVNTGLKKGDRVFIINGNYDSNLLIKKNKYRRGTDGYKVLFVDECRIVLDIDYTGELPYNNDIIDEFINVYYIRNFSDFIQANRQITTKGDNVDYKFNPYQNNIIYTDQDFTPILNWGQNLGLTGSPGFFVKNGTSSWINITNDFISGSFSIALSPTFSNNNRIKIHNGTFTYSIGPSVVEFKEEYVYKWGMGPEPDAVPGTYSTWITDVIYKKPIMSKGNFRSGGFKGRWNTGLYGTSDRKIKWKGDGKWYAGTLLNTEWERGTFDTLYTLQNSFLADFDQNGIPFQKSNEPNNNGWSFNYVIDSDFKESIINNGNVLNSKIGLENPTYSIVEKHILNESVTYKNKINKALFNSCSFLGGIIANSDIKKSRLLNTKLDNSKSINSSYKLSVIKDSSYLSDEIIKILNYDELNISEGAINGTSHKVYKFYISEKDYELLKIRERFYIKGLRISDNKYPLNFFDKRFRISTWTEYTDDYKTGVSVPNIIDNSYYKRGYEVGVFLSTPLDNKWRYNTFFDSFDYYSDITTQNTNGGYSIDIVVSKFDKNLQEISVSDLDFNSGSSLSFIGTASTSIANKIDISNAYILNSDFESGLFENSDWVNGYHINYQNDVNITDYSLEGGFYDLSILTASSTVIANTLFDVSTTLPEAGSDCLNEGNIVFLNAVYYDTRGKVDSVIISASGTSYSTATGLTVSGGSGQDLTVDIIANIIGEVTSTSIQTPGSNYLPSTYFPNYSAIGGSTGSTDLSFDITTSVGGSVIAATISNPGSGYQVGDIVTIPGGTPDAEISIDSVNNGEVLSVSINNGGIGYEIGNILFIQDGASNATIEVTSITGSLVRLPDTYKIIDNSVGILELQDINGTASIIQTLLDGGKFWTPGAENRWGYIHKAKINKSKIKSGIFRGSYIKESIIENMDYNTNDKDFEDLQKIKSLIISDTLFVDNENQLSKSLYINSSIVNGSDKFSDGIVFNSIWNGSTFSNGTFKDSTWLSGTFKNGVFYNNRSFNATPNFDYQFYYINRIKTYHKSGMTSPTVLNDRHSWQSGSFDGGLFYKSDWESGDFNNGTLYFSKFYSGNINGGIIGDNSVPVESTHVYNANINYTNVRNATFYAVDTSFYGLSNSTINWNDGIFESGVFGSDMIQSTASHQAIWNDGRFNGGQFISNAKWKAGIFNGGKFLSGFGWTTSDSTSELDYSWESGQFNGGEFGNANTATNSTWFTGEFNGGEFRGRVWNDGLFTAGDFFGSATWSAVGGKTSSNASSFVDSFSQSYYGLWRNGIFTDIKDKFIKDRKIFTDIIRVNLKKKLKIAKMENSLWLSGTFSHPNGETNNIVWLDGTFERGQFNNSSFNPYVKRNGATQSSFNFNDSTCYWDNGVLNNSDFYISNWNDGRFIIGTAYGMIWKNGVSNYMNAFNVFWENGLWRNGNWYGSSFDLSGDGEVTDDFIRQILFRGMSWSGTSSCHVWNIFIEEDSTQSNILSGETASSVTFTGIPLAPLPPIRLSIT